MKTKNKKLQLKAIKETEGNPNVMEDDVFAGLVGPMRKKGWYFEPATVVNFKNGYSKDAPSMTFNIIKIEKDKTPHNLKCIINTEFCYKIYLGSMLDNAVKRC